MDGGIITDLRTAAASAVATKVEMIAQKMEPCYEFMCCFSIFRLKMLLFLLFLAQAHRHEVM